MSAEPGTGGRGHVLRGAALRRVGALLLVGAVLGVVGGVVWEWLWTPPTGAAYQGRWMPDAAGLTALADATGWFVVVGATYGLLYGALAALLTRGHELATLLGVLLGALVAGLLTAQVGHWLGPDDANALARGMDDLEPLVSDLRLTSSPASWWPDLLGSTALLVPAITALMGVAAIYLCTDAGSRQSGTGRSLVRPSLRRPRRS